MFFVVLFLFVSEECEVFIEDFICLNHIYLFCFLMTEIFDCCCCYFVVFAFATRFLFLAFVFGSPCNSQIWGTVLSHSKVMAKRN